MTATIITTGDTGMHIIRMKSRANGMITAQAMTMTITATVTATVTAENG